MYIIFNRYRVMKHMSNFQSQEKLISSRYHSRAKLNCTYKPKVKRTIYYLSINTPYNREHFLKPMPPQSSIEVFLETLPSKVAEELLKDQEKYDDMKWEDIRRRRELHFLYNQEVDQHCKRITGYKFRQRPFNHFVQEQMEVEREFYFILGVDNLISSLTRDYVTQ